MRRVLSRGDACAGDVSTACMCSDTGHELQCCVGSEYRVLFKRTDHVSGVSLRDVENEIIPRADDLYATGMIFMLCCTELGTSTSAGSKSSIRFNN